MRPPRQVPLLSVTPRPVRRRFGGTVGSVLAHLVLLLLLYRLIDHDFATVLERGTPLLPQHGGGGGGGGEFVAIPAPVPQAAKPAVPPPVQHPVPVVMQPVPVTVPQDIPPPADTLPRAAAESTASTASAPAGGGGPGTGGGTGGGAGTGNGPGTGAGTGPGTGGGAGGHGRRPEPKRQVIPPIESAPKELRGRSVGVTFWVGADGKLLRFEVRPPIEDKGYARKFDEVMREQEFKPARGPDGQPVPDSVTFTWTF